MEEKDIERSTSFVIDMTDTHNEDGKTKRRGAAERRLASYKYKQISKERILKRQAEAALRKEDYERAKIERIKERSEECSKIDAKVKVLLAQDAKHRGLPGIENVKPMSTRQVVKSIQSLSKDFEKLKTGFKSTYDMDT